MFGRLLRALAMMLGTASALAAQPIPEPGPRHLEPEHQAPSAAAGEVVRALFTSAVQGREPVDNVLTLGANESHVYCFTELRGFAGQRVTHRWEYEGEVMAEVVFDVGGWRWRVWSRKNLLPQWRGQWRVSILDENGRVLLQRSLAYEPAGAFLSGAERVAASTP